MTASPRVRADEVGDFLAASALELDDIGGPRVPLVFVDLTRAAGSDAGELASAHITAVLVGFAPDGVRTDALDLASALDLTLSPRAAAQQRSVIAAPDLDAAMAAIERSVAANPRASVTLTGLLRATDVLPVPAGLIAESTAYSMLLGGAEFGRWRSERPARLTPPLEGAAVHVDRAGDLLDIRIDRPDRHNAYDRFVRDGLVEAFELALADPSITHIRLGGNGPSFCSGGDLDEFGTSVDVTTAHLIRLDRSVAARVHHLREKTHVLLHGACIGAGIEIPSFAAHVHATPDTFVQLPEVAMGLIPGAGGTVGITRRIGRWRTAYLALTGERIGLERALEWGLVDAPGD